MTAEAISKDIDPGRVGISKSTMTTPCERKAVYNETVRDQRGWRLDFPMPERVVFGSAVDEAHGYILWRARSNRTWQLAEAVELGMERARRKPSLVDDWDTFKLQLQNALVLFLEQPDGWARWEGELDGLRIQGLNGASLDVDGIIGTPDYLLGDWSVVDVKTWARSATETKFKRSPEMPLYSWLVANHTGGVIPPRLIYQAYVRTQKPKWLWLETPGLADHVLLGAEHVAHWRALMADPRPELAAVNTTSCGDCGFRDALPQYGHPGCAIGRLMPGEEEAA